MKDVYKLLAVALEPPSGSGRQADLVVSRLSRGEGKDIMVVSFDIQNLCAVKEILPIDQSKIQFNSRKKRRFFFGGNNPLP